MRKTKFRITFDDGEIRTVTLQAKPLEKNDGVLFYNNSQWRRS